MKVFYTEGKSYLAIYQSIIYSRPNENEDTETIVYVDYTDEEGNIEHYVVNLLTQKVIRIE